jgi:hypothetical protein
VVVVLVVEVVAVTVVVVVLVVEVVVVTLVVVVLVEGVCVVVVVDAPTHVFVAVVDSSRPATVVVAMMLSVPAPPVSL